MFQVYYHYCLLCWAKCVFWAINMPSAWCMGHPCIIKLYGDWSTCLEKKNFIPLLCAIITEVDHGHFLSWYIVGHTYWLLGPATLAKLESTSSLPADCLSVTLLIDLYSATIYNVFGRIRLRFFLRVLACVYGGLQSPPSLPDFLGNQLWTVDH